MASFLGNTNLWERPNFGCCTLETLHQYINTHRLAVSEDASFADKSNAVTAHFDRLRPDEGDVLGRFVSYLDGGKRAVAEYNLERESGLSRYDEENPAKRAKGQGGRSLPAPPPGGAAGAGVQMPDSAPQVQDHVAARTSKDDENGAYILAVVQRVNETTRCYEVADLDDLDSVKKLGLSHIQTLGLPVEAVKGDRVLAVFPDTTAFYRAEVAKQPKKGTGRGDELVVRFEDDEDETGRTPQRRVLVDHVFFDPRYSHKHRQFW